MRLSRAFVPTLKESPAEALVKSHVYMVRAGMIRRVAAGIYNFLPMGLRVVRKIMNIVREEMDAAGAQEVLMPTITPAELWQESGRWDKYGPELLRLQDRKGTDFCVGPTHEEVIVDMVRRDVRSYRDLPQTLYQIQGKFRDELRPRAGLLRGREFIMKDAYSFDVSEAAAEISYQAMFEAYEKIFQRCGLDFRPVEADTGSIGGSKSHEFQVLADSGEDDIVACDTCDYAANVEQAEVRKASGSLAVTNIQNELLETSEELRKVETPGAISVAQVAECLSAKQEHIVKTLVYIVDEEPIAVAVRGDREVNDLAIKKFVGAQAVCLATKEQVKGLLGVSFGSLGPVGLSIPVLCDNELAIGGEWICGANEDGYHFEAVSCGQIAAGSRFGHFRMTLEGDGCPRCDKGGLVSYRGIEVGHVFYLGTTYSNPLKCFFTDDAGKDGPMVMGCYGIGVTRIAAAAIEQSHDDAGICWPVSIAPYQVAILPLQMKDSELVSAAEKLYQSLQKQGIDVALDDRAERPGGKFKDADLVGYPVRIALGKRTFADGKVEVKIRATGETKLVAMEEAVPWVSYWVKTELQRLVTSKGAS